MARVLSVLTGPTAVGKTAAALAWAEARGAEVVSCDALLFYRGMDTGTAKPSAAELARVPHHLVDIRDVDKPMDIAAYVRLAVEAVGAVEARGRRVLVTGGSGFYLRAFLAPVVDAVEVPERVRAEVADLEARGGVVALWERLVEHHGGAEPGVDRMNPRRVARALERCLTTGRTVGELAEAFARQRPVFADREVRCVRLERPREVLAARVEARARWMEAAGLVAEVAELRRRGLERNPTAASAIGYRESLDVLDGRLERSRLVEVVAARTRGLVRKQATWFRHQLPPHAVVELGEREATVKDLEAAGLE